MVERVVGGVVGGVVDAVVDAVVGEVVDADDSAGMVGTACWVVVDP